MNHLPQTPGVYLFYGEHTDLPLYIGKSINIRQRVLSHVYAAKRDKKEQRLIQSSQSVNYIETAGEVGALLLEASLIKRYRPLLNRRLRKLRTLYYFVLDDANKLELKKASATSFQAKNRGVGLFRSQRQATEWLRDLAKTHQLCHKHLGLEHQAGPCFAYHLKRCQGVCVGEASSASHTNRLLALVQEKQHRVWPYTNKVGIKETTGDKQAIHWVDQWRYISTDRNFDTPDWPQAYAFDVDHYHILCKALHSDNVELVFS